MSLTRDQVRSVLMAGLATTFLVFGPLAIPTGSMLLSFVGGSCENILHC